MVRPQKTGVGGTSWPGRTNIRKASRLYILDISARSHMLYEHSCSDLQSQQPRRRWAQGVWRALSAFLVALAIGPVLAFACVQAAASSALVMGDTNERWAAISLFEQPTGFQGAGAALTAWLLVAARPPRARIEDSGSTGTG